MLENIVLIIPPAVELVFSFTLAVTSASVEGRNRWILVLDGLSFFLLALTDFLAHVIPKISSSVHVFSVIDTVIAAASLLPLLFYTVFLFLFARATLISFLPTRFSRIITLSLIAAIPPILATNEVSSLVGIAHTSLPTPNNAFVVGAGFSNSFYQRVSLFFSAASLAFLALFQALIFMVAFVRLARGFIEERRIETAKQDPRAREEIHLFRGLGWLAVGLKLGAIESVVGFATTSFAVVITRRTLRLFARGTLIIGIMKGLDIVEDITGLECDIRVRSRSTRRSKRKSLRFSRVMISNPRNSTFQQLSPDASNFHAAQSAVREKRGRIGPSPLALGGESNMARFDTELKDMDFKSPEFDNLAGDSPLFNALRSSVKANQRVTVHYDGKTPPVLQMRFSAVDIDVHPLPIFLPNPYDEQKNSPGSGRRPGHINGHVDAHDLDGGPKSAPLRAVREDLREDQLSLSEPDSDRQLFYGGYVPKTAPLPRTAPASGPPRPLPDQRRASYAAPSIISDVAMPFQDRNHDSPRSSLDSPNSQASLTQYLPRPSHDNKSSLHTPLLHTFGRDTSVNLGRSTRTVSAASDSLSVVREIAARFPGLPPRVVPGKTMPSASGTDPASNTPGTKRLSSSSAKPPGLGDDADADSDSEWRTLARARSLKRRQEMMAMEMEIEMEIEAQRANTLSGSGGAGRQGGNSENDNNAAARAGAGNGISPVNSIKRKPAPFSDGTQQAWAQGHDVHVDAAVSEAMIARAAVTARDARSVNVHGRGRGHARNPSLDDPLSYYSSDDGEGDTIDEAYSYTAQNAESDAGTGTGGQMTPGPWTPSTTMAITPGIRTSGSWIGGEEPPVGRLGGRAMAVGREEDLNMYYDAQAQAKLYPQQQLQPQGPQRKLQKRPRLQSHLHLQPQPQLQSQPQQLYQQDQVREEATLEERRRLRRLTLLRRELRASAHDSATVNAALEPELQAPWLHTDPLTQLQTIGSDAALLQLHGDDEDADAVLDDAWRRAGLTRIKSVSRVRVHTTPRVEQGFEVRGSLVAVEEEDEEDLVDMPVSPMLEQERRASVSTLKKPARLDLGVLAEEDRTLIRQGIRI